MMKQKFLLTILTCAGALMLLPQVNSPLRAAGDDDDSGMRLQEKETIRKSFNLTGASKILEVDNIFGSIEVTGSQSDQVQLVVNKTISANPGQDYGGRVDAALASQLIKHVDFKSSAKGNMQFTIPDPGPTSVVATIVEISKK